MIHSYVCQTMTIYQEVMADPSNSIEEVIGENLFFDASKL